MTTGIIILAAGASSRFGGEPKQLLTMRAGQEPAITLVRRAAELALAAQLGGPVVVVLGANRDRIAPELAGLPITVIDNNAYNLGLSSSIKIGLAGVYMTNKAIDTVVVLLCDQPLVTTALVQQLAATHAETGKPIVACRYGGTQPDGSGPGSQLGVPALFERSYFEELLQLDGDKGARFVLTNHPDDVAEIGFAPAALDLDSWEDVANFNARNR